MCFSSVTLACRFESEFVIRKHVIPSVLSLAARLKNKPNNCSFVVDIVFSSSCAVSIPVGVCVFVFVYCLIAVGAGVFDFACCLIGVGACGFYLVCYSVAMGACVFYFVG